jgi:hypothetical protein
LKNISIVENSGLHDYELREININYNGAQAKIAFVSPLSEKFELCIDNLISFAITHKEEWGIGKYVCASDIEYDAHLNLFIFLY